MKRPLAVGGFTVLLALLAASSLPAVFVLPLGVLLCAVGLVAQAILRPQKTPRNIPLSLVALVCCSAASALFWRFGYDSLVTKPVRALAGTEASATARVTALTDDNGIVYYATLEVLTLEGEAVSPFKVQVHYLYREQAAPAVGDILSLSGVSFDTFQSPSSRAYAFGKGVYVRAAVTGETLVVGSEPTLLDRVRMLQYGASANLREKLPERLGAFSAAITLGDRRWLEGDITSAFRAAGLSHLLVVSGLHMSLLCGVVYSLARRILKRHRAAAVAGIAFALFFMAFTGFSASIVRCGVVQLVLYTGLLFRRKPDVYTSLGLAAVLLCLQNPYAAADVGLLLSFAATLGALLSGEAADKVKARWQAKDRQKVGIPGSTGGAAALEKLYRPRLPVRVLRRLAVLVLTPLCVTAATLPVMVWAGMEISLLTIPFNIIALPLLAPVMLTGLPLALPAGIPVVEWLLRTVALVHAFLLSILEWLVNLALAVPLAFVSITGGFALFVLLVIYLQVYISARAGREKRGIAAALAVLALALALHWALEKDTIHITLAGSRNPSIVITRSGQSVVLYRALDHSAAIEHELWRLNAGNCILLVDMRQNAQSTGYESLNADAVVRLRDIQAGEEFVEILPDVTLYLLRQGSGTIAAVEAGGYTVASTTGTVDLSGYGKTDLLIAYSGAVTGFEGRLLTAGGVPANLSEGTDILYGETGAGVWIRPGKSICYKETWNGKNLR